MLGLEQQGELILYNKFSSQLDKGFQGLSETMLSIQKHTDCSAAGVHQNQQELDVLLFLQEECCFYANESGIVKSSKYNQMSRIAGNNVRPPIPGFSKKLYGNGHCPS